MEATSKPGRVWLKLQFARTAIITNGAKFIFSTIRASTPSGAGKFPGLLLLFVFAIAAIFPVSRFHATDPVSVGLKS
jgi:hypothetical protein